MNRKKDLREVTMTREALSDLLRGETRLSGEEEKVLRMRHGCRLDPEAPLTGAGAGHPDLQEELRLMECELLKAARQALGSGAAQVHRPQASREKSAIIQALRKKR